MWGTGLRYTSLILRGQKKKKNRAKILDFNAWKTGSETEGMCLKVFGKKVRKVWLQNEREMDIEATK